MVGSLASLAYKGHIAQLAFHHPLEVAAEETVDKEDVERSLMVGYEDIRLSFGKIFTTFHLHRQQKHTHDNPCPPLAGIVPPEVSVAKGATYNHCQSCKQGADSDYRKGDA